MSDEVGLYYALHGFQRGADWEAADEAFQACIDEVRQRALELRYPLRCANPETLEQAVARRRTVML